MTRDEIAELVLLADPAAQRYDSRRKTGDYTVWAEYRRLDFIADDAHQEGWAFQVDRYTRDERDLVAEAIFAQLDADPRVTVSHMVDFERDTGLIHHIFDCEGY